MEWIVPQVVWKRVELFTNLMFWFANGVHGCVQLSCCFIPCQFQFELERYLSRVAFSALSPSLILTNYFFKLCTSYPRAWLTFEGRSDCPCWNVQDHPNVKGTCNSSAVGFLSCLGGKGSSWITCIFVLFQFTAYRFNVFHVCFSADVKQNCLTSKSSFHGCLRKLVLTKGQQVELFDFSRAFDLRGVFPHSCPGAEHWTAAELVWSEREFLLICYFSFSFCNEKKNWWEPASLRFFWLFPNSGHLFFCSQKLYVCILTKRF